MPIEKKGGLFNIDSPPFYVYLLKGNKNFSYLTENILRNCFVVMVLRLVNQQ